MYICIYVYIYRKITEALNPKRLCSFFKLGGIPNALKEKFCIIFTSSLNSFFRFKLIDSILINAFTKTIFFKNLKFLGFEERNQF